MATVRLIRSPEEATSVIAPLTYWVNILPPREMKWARTSQFWLGASPDFDRWTLFAFPYGDEDIEPRPSSALAWLDGANEKNIKFIGRVLLEAYEASRNPGGIASIGSVSIPGIPSAPAVADVGLMFPAEWLPWPARLEVSFELSEQVGLTADLFEEYQRITIRDALSVVLGPRVPGLLIRYSVNAELDAVPMLPYVVDRPLRGGKKIAPAKRPRGDFAQMCVLYQHVARRVGFGGEPAYSDKHTVRLRVGGKSSQDAEQNWDTVAQGLT